MLDDWDFIKQNKPVTVKTGTLRMRLSMGVLSNEDWKVESHEHWKSVIVTVRIDQDTIFSDNVVEPKDLCWQFPDTDVCVDHQLTVSVQGLDQLAEKNVMISMSELFLEDMSLDKIVEFTGTYTDSDQTVNVAGTYMGKDGCTTIPFSTPIYRWLYDNQHHFI
jgi:hypothetical protein